MGHLYHGYVSHNQMFTENFMVNLPGSRLQRPCAGTVSSLRWIHPAVRDKSEKSWEVKRATCWWDFRWDFQHQTGNEHNFLYNWEWDIVIWILLSLLLLLLLFIAIIIIIIIIIVMIYIYNIYIFVYLFIYGWYMLGPSQQNCGCL